LLVGGCALFVATFGYTRWMMFHLGSRTRLSAAAATLVVLLSGAVLPEPATLALLVVVRAALNVRELTAVHQASRVLPR
jgi:hypothetical protein